MTALSPTAPAPKTAIVLPDETFSGFQTAPAPVTTPQPRGQQVIGQVRFADLDQSAGEHWPPRGSYHVSEHEPQRAFYGNQFGLTFPVFVHYGVPLWVPEVGGPIDPESEAHDLVMSVFGGISKGERNRIKIRVRTAMASQAKIEGRFLGGRPPYGYLLVDAGPHPNPSKAADGKRLHRLEPDPVTAPIVERIFAEFLAGFGILAIALRLTADGIPCPSAYDRERNRHRHGDAWSKSAVRVILTNPRYTGRQVWNKQRREESLIDVEDVALGHETHQKWNPRDAWVFSDKIVHQPLVAPQVFQDVQDRLASRGPTSPRPHAASPKHGYAFKSRLKHRDCGRRMQGTWTHDEAYYRCRYPREYLEANHLDHPQNVYLREHDLRGPIDSWLTQAFAPAGIEHSLSAMQDAQPTGDARGDALRRTIAECDRKLSPAPCRRRGRRRPCSHRRVEPRRADPADVREGLPAARAEVDLRP
ncbi:recombinase family protein [Streptomyces sp. NPDC058001]|uniref:recombinase family protein n=1 Tax=Streptomyces sp. NPDC058001 TaxID=3346300 RepID=UPI0036EEB321